MEVLIMIGIGLVGYLITGLFLHLVTWMMERDDKKKKKEYQNQIKSMKNKDAIDPDWGVPLKHISCPGCGQKYGHDDTKACENCQECSACCNCRPDQQKLIPGAELISQLLE